MTAPEPPNPLAGTDPVATDRVLPLSWRSRLVILAASMVGVLAFSWPLLAPVGSQLLAHAADAPLIFAVLVPLLLAVAFSLVTEGGLDAKAVAILGVLAAVAAALRALGAGIAGLEPIWVVIVLGGYAMGAGFGFLLGSACLLASALVTGGIGPWLPFQLLGAAWVGLGAGLLGARRPRATGPAVRTRVELPVLAAYGAIAAVAYGWLLNLWFWPTLGGLPAPISFVPGAGAGTNLVHWFTFNITTSLGYDLPRAALTVTLILLLGPRVLRALDRTRRRASFAAAPQFVAPSQGGTPRE